MKAYAKKTRFIVWGFGITGRALARVLNDRGYPVQVVEDKGESKFSKYSSEISNLRKKGVSFHFGGISNLGAFLKKEADVLTPSPGIAISEKLVNDCEAARVQIAGEIEIAGRLVQGKIIAVTGTDGKTTTATLIHHILSSSGLTSHLAGNVGSPLIELTGKTRSNDWLVIEVSSYQLETVRLFYPRIAVLLNIAEDHLERHGDIRSYMRIKGRIFDRQRNKDHALVNFDDPACLLAYGQAASQLRGFSLAGPVPDGVWRDKFNLMFDDNGTPRHVLDTRDLRLHGDHNHLNMLAAILACRIAGCSLNDIANAAIEFEGLPHRLEVIGKINGVTWVNDSKATNIHSTISALKCYDKPIILILGGYEKNLSLVDLIPYIFRHVRHVMVMGETRNRFRKTLREAGFPDITTRKTLQEACSAASNLAEPGDVVLLSPASSSFDQFTDYIERGETFRKWVTKKLGSVDS